MAVIPAVLLALIVASNVLLLSGVFSEVTWVLIQRHFPRLSRESAAFLLVGLLVVSAFATGLVVMRLLKPYS
jgi:hypothetical protein